MDTPLPPDPYLALGLPRDTDQATIKATYRKLVLKCHPDKVTDESLKKQKQEEFHKIQQAYEVIGEEAAREEYHARLKLETLRREKAAREAASGGSRAPDVQSTGFKTRMQAPTGASFKTSPSSRYESSRSYDDRYYEERSRTYDAYPSKHSSSRRSSEKVSPQKATRESSDRTRSSYKKASDKERERDRRHVASERERDSSDPSGDEKTRYEADYKRRSDDARRRAEEEEARKQAESARRRADERRSYEEYDRKQKERDQVSEAARYIHRSRVETDRPAMPRTGSSRDPRDYYDSRDRDSRSRRPEVVRRSSARPRDRHSPPGRGDRRGPEIVEWSSTADAPPRATPHRSHTETSRDHRRSETSPPPAFRRSETMPTQVSSASRKPSTVPRPSGLRESESTPASPEAYATIPPPSSTTKRYYYSTPGGGVSLGTEDVGEANGHRTVLREPERPRHRSPSPLNSRPPMGANRHPETTSAKYTTASNKSPIPPPPLGRSVTMNAADDRGRSRLYGEIDSDHLRRENARHQTSFSPERVQYARKFGPEDVNWAPRRDSGRDRLERDVREQEYKSRPVGLGRTATYVF